MEKFKRKKTTLILKTVLAKGLHVLVPSASKRQDGSPQRRLSLGLSSSFRCLSVSSLAQPRGSAAAQQTQQCRAARGGVRLAERHLGDDFHGSDFTLI